MDSATLHHPGQRKFHQVTDSLPPQQITLNIVCVCCLFFEVVQPPVLCNLKRYTPRNMGTPLFSGEKSRISKGVKNHFPPGGSHRPPTPPINRPLGPLQDRPHRSPHPLRTFLPPLSEGEWPQRPRFPRRWQIFKVTTFRLVEG